MPIRPEDELGTHVANSLSANYELESEIGRGGMGIVYSARDKRLKRHVAIKVLPPELAFRADIKSRFLREAETAAQLNYPNIVPIYTVEEKDNIVFFVMALITGENLGTHLAHTGAMPPVDVRRILREVAEALAFAHHRNVIHRDIKPDNILLDAESGRAMVTDFGIARALTDSGDSRLTATGMAIGTPAFMSPEQSAGDRAVDGRSDLYSLGVVGYQMLCGQLPFVASNTPSMLVKHLSEQPIPVNERWPDLPADLCRAVMICLEKDPDNRFPNAAALATALNTGEMPALSTQPTSARGMVNPPPFRSMLPAAPHMPTNLATSPHLGSAAGTAGSAFSPTQEEVSKWNAPSVVKFRRSLAPFLAVNAIIVPMSIFTSHDFFFVTIFWGIGLAVRYSKLWSAGYDWRDVFRQPRDRLFFDVAAETIDDARALFDEKKRDEVRARARARGNLLRQPRGQLQVGVPMPSMGTFGRGRRGRTAETRPVAMPQELFENGPYASTIREAQADHAEIHRQLLALTPDEREQMPDVAPSADAVLTKMQRVASALSDVSRAAGRETPEQVESEIEKLEAAANPLETRASEERVRRLAYLRRQRRALAEFAKKREEASEKIEHCRQLLKSMRLELLRYRSGGLGAQPTGVTMVTQQAQGVVREMGYLSDAAAELNAL
ncbi:MAG: protein kinase [Gemmatimonadaceae bacterium]|nr:protein kinase [Gemmatimonadaceae bacterium]